MPTTVIAVTKEACAMFNVSEFLRNNAASADGAPSGYATWYATEARAEAAFTETNEVGDEIVYLDSNAQGYMSSLEGRQNDF